MPLASVGRMALTNYLLHSVAAVPVFYGIGLGLFRRVSLTVALVMALGFFVLQVLLSRWWLQRATFGLWSGRGGSSPIDSDSPFGDVFQRAALDAGRLLAYASGPAGGRGPLPAPGPVRLRPSAMDEGNH